MNTTMRSAGKVASASSIATPGSLSPVSPAASMPSSSRRSTVSSCSGLRLADRVVGVGDPERHLGLVGGRRDHEDLGALHLVAERGTQQVRVDGFGRDDKQLHIAVATPRAEASNGAAEPSGRTTTTATSSRAGRRGRPARRARRPAAIAAGSAPAKPASTCASRSGPSAPIGLRHAVGVEHERVPGHELDAALGRAPASSTIPSRVPGAADGARRRRPPAARAAADGRRRPGARVTPSSRRGRARVHHRAEAVVERARAAAPR